MLRTKGDLPNMSRESRNFLGMCKQLLPASQRLWSNALPYTGVQTWRALVAAEEQKVGHRRQLGIYVFGIS